MSVDSRADTVDATGQVKLANANFIFILSASVAVTVQLIRGGTTETFQNVTGGLNLARLKSWEFARIIAPAGTTLTYYYGIMSVREDFTAFSQQLATISGSVTTLDSPSATLADTASKLTVAVTQAALVPVNLARRRVTIFSRVDNVGDGMVFIRKTGGANDIGFIQPGTFIQFSGTYGLDYRAVAGGDTLLIFEES